MPRRTYHGDGIEVHWNSELCIHTALCLNALPDVFDSEARPWIKLEGQDADSVAAAVEQCPSGALTYERTDGAVGEQAPDEVTVIPWPNGPLMVRGQVEVRDRRGNEFASGARFSLCRCGASENQPFCDLSHRGIGFRDNPHVVLPERGEADSPGQISPDPLP